MGYIYMYFVLQVTKSRLIRIEEKGSENENLQKQILGASHFEKKCWNSTFIRSTSLNSL